MQAATCDFIVIQHAGLEYNPEEFSELLLPLLTDSADIVYGSRFLSGWRNSGTIWWHYGINRALTILSNVLSGLSLSDRETCYKMLSRNVANDIRPRLVSDRFEIEPEITSLIARGGYRIKEVAITYKYRPFGRGKKIGWRDGIGTIRAILWYNMALFRRSVRGNKRRAEREVEASIRRAYPARARDGVRRAREHYHGERPSSPRHPATRENRPLKPCRSEIIILLREQGTFA